MVRLLALLAAIWLVGCASPVGAQEQPSATLARPPLVTNEQAMREDRVRTILAEQMRRCWQMPIDLPNPERLSVTVAFELNPDGTLRGTPRVVSPRNYQFDAHYRTAVERAIRAIRECAPYPFPNDEIVGPHYGVWDELELHFHVRP
jgi:hypothetical protein